MGAFESEARAFRKAKEKQVAQGRQCAAFFLISGMDLAEALESSGEERAAILARLGRLIERERLKGTRKHWSYDLNRHIALKQVYDRLAGQPEARQAFPPDSRTSRRTKAKRHPSAPLYVSKAC